MKLEQGVYYGAIDLCSGGRNALKVIETIEEGREGEFNAEQKTPQPDGTTKKEQLTVHVVYHQENEPAELLVVHTVSYKNSMGVTVRFGRSFNEALNTSFLAPGKAVDLPMNLSIGHRPPNSL